MSTNQVLSPTIPDPIPVTDVIAAAVAGDGSAWADLIRRYTPLVRARMAPYQLQEADRADVAQTVWLRLAENLHRLHTPAHIGGWLATVVARECQLNRRKAGRSVLVADLLGGDAADHRPRPDEVVVATDLARRLWDAVAQLPPARRRLMCALFADTPRSYAEISQAVGIPVGGIGPTRNRAISQLRTMLADDSTAWLGS